MTTLDSDSADRILALDEHISNDWLVVNVVTQTEIMCVGLKVNQREEVLHLLGSGASPLQTLKKAAPLLQGPSVIRLSDIRGLEWHADNQELRCRYIDQNKGRERVLGLNLSGDTARKLFVSTIESVLGKFDEVEVPASIWHVGLSQLIYAAVAFTLSVSLAIAVHYDAGKGKPIQQPIQVRRRHQALAELLKWIGPAGILIIGGIIIAVLMVWWYVACRKRPVKTIATLRLSDAS